MTNIKRENPILLVDDDLGILEAISLTLCLDYQTVHCADSGDKALFMIKQHHYDLLIVDLNMPTMNGYHLIKNIIEQDTSNMMFIVLTGTGSFKEARLMLRDLEISDFLSKPVERTHLLFSIDRALREQAKDRKLQQYNNQLEGKIHNVINTLQRTQEKLAHTQRIASLSTLAAGIAHKLNTPIGNLNLLITMLEDNAQHFATQIQQHDPSQQSCTKFLTGISQVTDGAKKNIETSRKLITRLKELETDQLCSDSQKFNLHDVVSSTFSNYILHQPIVSYHNNIPAEIELNNSLGAFIVVLNELINNSLTHGFAHSPKGAAITISATQSDKVITIKYKDNGSGLDEAHFSKIFHPFYSLSNQSDANGIGLSIVFNVVTSVFKGTIECLHQPNAGLEFVIFITAPIDSEQTR